VRDIPPLAEAVVTAQDPDNYGVFVTLLGQFGGQGPAIPVKVLTHGPRDAVRGSFPELPLPGQTGLVAFTRGDIRNGRWLGSTEQASVDTNPNVAGGLPMRYSAHYDGSWHYGDHTGTAAHVFADGSILLAGASLPAPTRHTIDANQVRQATPYTHAQRRPVPLGALPYAFTHASGTSVSVAAGGAASVTVAAGQTLTISVAGATLVFDGAGNVTLSASGGAALKLTGALATISTGGAAQPVKLASGGNSTVLMAQ
jgi:hypothetical protein